jgi:hypothetical protein
MTDDEAAALVRYARSLWDQEAQAASDVVPDGGSVRTPMLLIDSAGNPTVRITTPATQTSDVQPAGTLYDAQRTQDRAAGVITIAGVAARVDDATRNLAPAVAQPIIKQGIAMIESLAADAAAGASAHAQRCNDARMQKRAAPTAQTIVAAQQASASARDGMINRLGDAWMQKPAPEHAAMVERYQAGGIPRSTAPVVVAAQRSSAEAHAAMTERLSSAWKQNRAA